MVIFHSFLYVYQRVLLFPTKIAQDSTHGAPLTGGAPHVIDLFRRFSGHSAEPHFSVGFHRNK